jgi:hypothetical protein
MQNPLSGGAASQTFDDKKPVASTATGLNPTGQTMRGSAHGSLLLPRAFLVTMRLQALAALVLVHLQTAFLFQVAHGA